MDITEITINFCYCGKVFTDFHMLRDANKYILVSKLYIHMHSYSY